MRRNVLLWFGVVMVVGAVGEVILSLAGGLKVEIGKMGVVFFLGVLLTVGGWQVRR